MVLGLLLLLLVGSIVLCAFLYGRVLSLERRNEAILHVVGSPVVVINREGYWVKTLNAKRFLEVGMKGERDSSFNVERYFVNEEDKQARRRMIARCIDENCSDSLTVLIRDESGNYRRVKFDITSNYGEYALEMPIDVTQLMREQVHSEILNRGRAKQLSLILKSVRAMPWVIGPKEDCDILGNDRSGLPLELQVPEEDQLHLQDNDFAAIDAEYRAAVREVVRQVFAGEKEIGDIEFKGRITRHQVESVWFRAACTPLRCDANGKVISVVGCTALIEERKRAEFAIMEAKRRAEESDLMKSVFLSNMSHEVRTPLNAILGFSKLISSAESPEEVAEFEQIIDTNGELLLNIINDVLDLSKIEAGKFKIEKSPIEINTVCDVAVSSVMPKVGRNVKVSFERTMPDLKIMADSKRIMQVMMQLVGNAIKYTHKGSVKVYCQPEGENLLKISVIDTGDGIGEEHLPYVFNRFYRASKSEPGTGLGLPIAKTIVEQWGGTIGVESSLGKGSTFWFTVPIEPC